MGSAFATEGLISGTQFSSTIISRARAVDFRETFIGNWVVRDASTPIPEPSTMLLLASG
jgi:hypothetical protein